MINKKYSFFKILALGILLITPILYYISKELGMGQSAAIIRGGAKGITKWGENGEFVFVEAESPIHLYVATWRGR